MTQLLDHNGHPWQRKDCDVCMGHGMMPMDGKMFRCTRCGGTGRLEESEPVHTQLAVQRPTDPLAMIAEAVSRGIDPDQLGKLMDLQERVAKARALEAFNVAMSACQGEMPAIPKDSTNSHTKSQYASWEGLNKLIRPVYAKHGFALMYGEIVRESGDLHLYVDVAHVGGHTKRFEGMFPRDGTGIKGNSNMTALQGVGSTRSYAKRYLAKDVFCLAEGGEDDDGQLTDTLIAEEVDEINELIIRNNRDRAGLLKWIQAESVEKILRKDFSKVVFELKRKRGNGA